MNIAGFKVEEFLPHYLTVHQRQGLARALVDFDENSNLYTQLFPEDALQGDCWEGVPYIDYASGESTTLKAVLLSNSCDIDPNNHRDFPIQITCAPLISLAKYEAALKAREGLDEAAISGKLSAIRKQHITNMIFFPAGHLLEEDCIAMLDRALSLPYKLFFERKERKLFTLNQLGHYLLSFKLSVHFCRLQEGIARTE